MTKWTEVSAYSGMPVEEDAPTNATGAAVAGTGDDSSVVVMKKKKKTFLDARTKAYKEHQKRLEAARARREERKKNASKINEEQIDEVNVTFIKKFAADMKKDKQFKPYADKFMKLAMKGGSPRDALEKAVPDFIAGKDIEKLISKNRMSNIFGEGTYHIAKDMSKLKKKMQSKMKYDAANFKVAIRHIGDDQMSDELQKLKPNEDMRPIIKKAMQRLGIKEEKTFTQKVQEQIGGFGRESSLAENNMEVIKSIVKSKGAKDLKMKDGKMLVDLFSASAIMNVYNKVNPNNKKKMEKLANGTRADLGKLQRLAMKFA